MHCLIFKHIKTCAFVDRLRVIDSSPVTNDTDVNICLIKFMSTLSNAFNDCFHLVKLSRRRDKDNKWITGALKKCWVVKIQMM